MPPLHGRAPSVDRGPGWDGAGRKIRTTVPGKDGRRAGDPVNRDFHAPGPPAVGGGLHLRALPGRHRLHRVLPPIPFPPDSGPAGIDEQAHPPGPGHGRPSSRRSASGRKAHAVPASTELLTDPTAWRSSRHGLSRHQTPRGHRSTPLPDPRVQPASGIRHPDARTAHPRRHPPAAGRDVCAGQRDPNAD